MIATLSQMQSSRADAHTDAFRIIAYHARIYAADGNLLNAYRDHYDRLAIGYDHTRSTVEGQRITEAKALELLRCDLGWLFAQIVPMLDNAALNVNQWNALLSFAHSMRFADFRQTTVLARIRCRRLDDVGAEMCKHVDHAARTLRTLMRRRASESELWEMPA